MNMRRVLLAFSLCLGGFAAQAEEVTIFAASSLKTALDEIVTTWEAETGHEVLVSYGASSALARQIQSGAPADIFFSANQAWMDVLVDDGLLAANPRPLLGNDLVVVGAEAEPLDLTAQTIAQRLETGPLAMAMVNSVPAGLYGKEALTALGLWGDIAPMVAQTSNARAALALVALGEAPLGIVYGSDAVAEPRVSVVARFAETTHAPIVYPVAQVTTRAPAADLVTYLASSSARNVFIQNGFSVRDE
ncbi:molybdate ABC transporter substrate-binding protein [Shimia sp. CNT1-13L.2]|uniref:molybdate ABC transporter substrate-binding protein n=1 Tax=Shimia sp. CNT1-13L.2 TaxID=2959663 RepID=UPI0020CDBF50|nr:molybdate ABC transporter substrate-binding protein [Shimia sp. CNT1-13L.2]MCP9481695.1 molybdate ABC transporter substrate-binding protein [Shimia sp. CNT1-13L.2]